MAGEKYSLRTNECRCFGDSCQEMFLAKGRVMNSLSYLVKMGEKKRAWTMGVVMA